MIATTATVTDLPTELSTLWDKATDDREIVVLRRSGAKDVALIDVDELDSLLETAYLLRSPANAARLHHSLAQIEAGEGRQQTVAELRAEFGLWEDKEDAEVVTKAEAARRK